MKKYVKKISDVMNYGNWHSKLLLLFFMSISLVLGAVVIDQLVNIIRLLINIEVFALLSPVFAMVILLTCQVKYPKDKTRTYSKFAKDRM
ncbi:MULTISPECIES: hypothetical protein [Staphylococcus]|uniref:hypothetical protein n=1 Tax=Staphylococcus TaxID=1279 RepID=UPI0027394FAC|nr:MULTISPECIES: hypothetical protein [Staphylococcus]MDP4468661.1 hypothetical protein [Staphylococcus hyicus]MDT0700370.1 hypothetical protein [Staphylococcus chromogenes]